MKGETFMAPEAVALNDMLDTLEKDDYNTIMEYIRLLSAMRKKERAMKTMAAMREFEDIIGGEKGWNSEEDMLADMAAFRRKRIKI